MVQRLVQNHCTYIVLRGNTYYFRMAMPLHILRMDVNFPKEIKRSLGTDSLAQALTALSSKYSLIEQLQKCADKGLVRSLLARLVDFTSHSSITPPASSQESLSPIAPKFSGLVLSEAWDRFALWKGWRTKIAKDYQRMFENLMYFIGNVDVFTITKKHLQKALKSISELPQRNKGLYRGIPLDKLANQSVPDSDRVSGKYVKDHLKLAQSLFNRYLVREVDVLPVSPTKGLSWEYENKRFAHFGDTDVRNLLQKSKAKPEWFRWFLLLAVYSGARRSEIANLKTEDFKLDPDTGRHYFVISGGKTEAARRCVPVHSVLVQRGLLDWVKDKSGVLFPTTVANPNRVTDIFSGMLDHGENDVGERYVFHSVRHTFITKARAAGNTDVLVQQLVGHEKRGAGITDRYTHTLPLASMLQVVDSVVFE